MSSFDWSSDARSTLHLLSGVDFIVYVEGQDDIPFWDVLFSKFTDKRYKIKSVGDKSTLLKYLKEKQDVDTYLIAMDSDLDKQLGFLTTEQVVLTYGYSIENSIISIDLIKNIIATSSRRQLSTVESASITKWLVDFEEASLPLLAAELVNKNTQITTEQITPKNVARFVEGNNHLPNKAKINNHLAELGFDFEKITSDFNLIGIQVHEAIKGHFLFSAALVFVKNQVKAFSKVDKPISNEAFYSSCISEFKSTFNTNHPHHSYYKEMLTEHLGALGAI